jgi:hypothetical protein
MGKSGKEVETLFHIGRRQRQRLQTLTSFPEILQEAVSDGRVTATNAVRLMQHIKLNPKSKLEAWLDWIIKHEATYKELNAALNKATSRNREQKPVELFAVGHKRGKKFLRLRPVTIDATMSDSQKEALLLDLKLVLKFLQEI